jgi:hypothetical protein
MANKPTSPSAQDALETGSKLTTLDPGADVNNNASAFAE